MSYPATPALHQHNKHLELPPLKATTPGPPLLDTVLVPLLSCPEGPHAPCGLPQQHPQLPDTVDLEGNALHLPREKDPDHSIKYCWIHVVWEEIRS